MSNRPPLPPFTAESAALKARAAEDAWNSRDPGRVALAYTEDSRRRNRAEFLNGRAEILAFLERKWARELDYRLIKEVWAYTGNRIAVRFAYEWHDSGGAWFRSYGNENWEFLVLPRHVFMPFQTALAVSRSVQALGLARTFGPVRGSSWGGAEAGERLPVRCLRRADPFCFAILASQNAQGGRHGHPCDACVAPPRVTSRPLGGRHVVRAADIISRPENRRKGQDDSHTCRRRPCFTAHATPLWLACADVAQMAHTGRVTRLRARSNACSPQNPCRVARRNRAITDCFANENSESSSVMAIPSLTLIISPGLFVRYNG